MWHPDTYVVERVADGLAFPTSVTFDGCGTAFVAESGLDFDGAAPGGRIWAIPRVGERLLIADGLEAVVNG